MNLENKLVKCLDYQLLLLVDNLNTFGHSQLTCHYNTANIIPQISKNCYINHI